MPLQFMLRAEAQHRMFQHLPNDLVGMPVGQAVGRMPQELRGPAEERAAAGERAGG